MINNWAWSHKKKIESARPIINNVRNRKIMSIVIAMHVSCVMAYGSVTSPIGNGKSHIQYNRYRISVNSNRFAMLSQTCSALAQLPHQQCDRYRSCCSNFECKYELNICKAIEINGWLRSKCVWWLLSSLSLNDLKNSYDLWPRAHADKEHSAHFGVVWFSHFELLNE